ncbi:hypothetical protein K474DRAFT_1774807 [Panus rudis PR-1116 ss-1]|nr:hypothetical protein K474DRAFT_1774807 [Panus rudis PR-1116 ss-1]
MESQTRPSTATDSTHAFHSAADHGTVESREDVETPRAHPPPALAPSEHVAQESQPDEHNHAGIGARSMHMHIDIPRKTYEGPSSLASPRSRGSDAPNAPTGYSEGQSIPSSAQSPGEGSSSSAELLPDHPPVPPPAHTKPLHHRSRSILLVEPHQRPITKATGWTLNIAIGSQVLLGALTTGIAAAAQGKNASIATAILGGLSTLAASYLAKARGSGEPETSFARCQSLEHFVRDCEGFLLDYGELPGREMDLNIRRYRMRFEEIMGNDPTMVMQGELVMSGGGYSGLSGLQTAGVPQSQPQPQPQLPNPGPNTNMTRDQPMQFMPQQGHVSISMDPASLLGIRPSSAAGVGFEYNEKGGTLRQ